MESRQRHRLRSRFGTVLVFVNHFFALGAAFLLSMADNLSVRGGGFSVYAGPLNGGDSPQGGNGGGASVSSSILQVRTLESEDSATVEESTDNESGQEVASVETDDGSNSPEPTPVPVARICNVPAGWTTYTIPPGLTLGDIARATGISSQRLIEVNCLESDQIFFGNSYFVPVSYLAMVERPSPENPIIPSCGAAPADWVWYQVRFGDNVYQMARGTGYHPTQVAAANCLASESHIEIGQLLRIPPNSALLAQNGPFDGAIPTAEPTATQTAQPPADTPVPVPTDTLVPTNTPTQLPTPTATATVGSYPEPIATNTPTSLPTLVSPTVTNTPVPTATDNPDRPIEETPATPIRPEETPSATPSPTAPPTETPIPTETPVDTLVPTNTPENTPAPTETEIPTETIPPTETSMPTATVAPTETPIDTLVPTETPADTPVPTATPVDTPVPTEPPADTPVPTATPIDTPVPTPTETPEDTPAP